MAKGASLWVQLGIDTTKWDRGLKSATRGITSFSSSISTVSKVAVIGVGAMTSAMLGLGVASLKVGAEFQQSMALINSILGKEAEGFDRLEAKARELGATTLFTARESADAMVELARAGLSANEVIAASGPSLKLAGATAASMTTATKGMAAALTMFSLPAYEAAHVADVFAIATRKSMFDLQGLNDALKYAGPVASSFGLSLEETTAHLMLFRNMGLESHQAGVYFRMMMSKLAKVTPQAERALLKYNLTANDLNIAMNKDGLAGVMALFGGKAIEAGDQMTIFGTRAGGVITKLGQEFAAETTRYHEYMEAIEDGAGAHERQYAIMIDAVQAQATITKSAFEDILITIFGTFSEGTKELFMAVTEILGEVATVLGREGMGMTNSFSASMRGLIDYLKANKRSIAEGFVSLIWAMQAVLKILIKIVPWLKTIGYLIVAGFSAYIIYTFVAALQVMVLAIMEGTFAATAFGIAMTAATAGLNWLAAGIAAFVVVAAGAAYVFWDWRTNADRLRDALEALDKQTAKNAQTTKENHTVMRDAAISYYTDMIAMQGENATMSDDQLRLLQQHTNQLINMTEAGVEAALAEGQLVEVYENGKSVIKSVSLIYDEMNGSAAQAAKAEEQLTKAVAKTGERLENLTKQREDDSAILTMYTASSQQAAAAAFRDSWFIGKMITGSVDKYYAARDVTIELSAAYVKQGEKVDALSSKYAGLTANVKAHTQAAELSKKMKDTEDKRERGVDGLTDDQVRKAKARRKAIDTARKASFETFRKLAYEARDLSDSGYWAEAHALEERLRKVQDTFDKELKLLRKHGARYKAAVVEMNYSLGHVRRNFLMKTMDEAEELHTKHAEELRKLNSTEEEDEQAAYDKRLAVLGEWYQKKWNAIQSNFHDEKERWIAERSLQEQGLKLRASLEDIYNEKRRQARIANTQKLNSYIAKLESKGAQNYESEKNAMMIEFQKKRKDLIKKGSEEEQRLIKAMFTAEENIRQKHEDNVEDIMYDGNKEVYKLEKKAQKQKLGVMKKIYAEKVRHIRKMDSLEEEHQEALTAAVGLGADKIAEINAIYSLRETEALDEHSKKKKRIIKKVLKDIGKAFIDAGKATAQAFRNVFDKGTEYLEKFTGFSFNLVSALGDLSSLMKEAGEAGEAFDLEDAAKKYVDQMIDGSIEFLSMTIKAIPLLLQRLAERIPELLNAFAEGLPLIMAAIADALPPLVSAIVGIVPALIDAVMQSIPQLVTAIADSLVMVLEMLPALIGQILGNLPELIPAIVNAVILVVQTFVAQIPLIIEEVVKALPTLLAAAVDGFLALVMMIVEQLPLLMSYILEAIPVLLMAVLELVPMMVEKIMMALPTIIMGFIKQLPRLITAFVTLIPTIMLNIIAALPTIIEAFIKGFFEGFIRELPKIAIMLILAILEALMRSIEKLAQAFGDIFRTKKGRKRAQKRRSDKEEKRLADSAARYADIEGMYYSGISYVPANMRVQVHEGEAIIPADRNAARTSGGPPMAGASGSGGAAGSSAPIDIAIMAEGRLLDSIQVTAMDRGHAPKLSRRLTRASGIDIGFDRGSFNPWTK